MIERLRAEWRQKLFSFDQWIYDRHRDGSSGMLDGVWLKPIENIAPYGAYFKPTCKCKVPVAAREKIVADLAFDLAIPAVPVLLCDSAKRFGAQQDQCCVSLVTHPAVYKWTLVLTDAVRNTPSVQKMLRAAPEPLSRIAVFDLWIDNHDRDNAGNIVYGEDPTDPTLSTFCALDHDVSLGGKKQSWRKGGWQKMTLTPFPEQLRAMLDKTAMVRTAEAIQRYPDDEIKHCIERIPDRYMDNTSKNDALDGLIGRKASLSAFVLQQFEKG